MLAGAGGYAGVVPDRITAIPIARFYIGRSGWREGEIHIIAQDIVDMLRSGDSRNGDLER